MVVKNSGVAQTTPDEWIQCTLADACGSINYGLTASASSRPDGPKFLRITDIVSGQVNWKTVPHVEADEDTIAKYRLYDGDIVIARTGASTGTSAYVNNPPNSVFASYLVRLQASPEFDSRFLAYYLKSKQFAEYIGGVLGDKSAQPNASASTMTAAPIRAPKDKSEQRAISHILGTLDDKIELNRRMNVTLEEMARALFKSWFVDFDPVRAKMDGRWRPGESLPGLPAEHYDLFPNRLVHSELGKIPDGWEVMTLGDIVEHRKGSVSPSKFSDRLFEHYSIPAFDRDEWPSIQMGHEIKSNKTPVPDGVVMLSKLNPEFSRVWIPDPPSGMLQIASTEFLAYSPRGGASRELLYCLFKSFRFSRILEGMVTGTSKSHQRVPPAALLKQEVIAGAAAAFEAFQRATAPITTRSLASKQASRALAALRDALLPKLLTGEVQVEDTELFVGSMT